VILLCFYESHGRRWCNQQDAEEKYNVVKATLSISSAKAEAFDGQHGTSGTHSAYDEDVFEDT
jgi:hypothetical protein